MGVMKIPVFGFEFLVVKMRKLAVSDRSRSMAELLLTTNNQKLTPLPLFKTVVQSRVESGYRLDR